MSTNNFFKKVVTAVTILLVLLFVMLKLSQQNLQPTDQLSEKNSQSKTAQIQKVPEESLPNKFPTDLPSEKDALITQNFNATENDGRYNATREFESKKTLAQNISLYTQYLIDKGWDIKAKVDQPLLKMVMGKKGNQQLQISAAQNPSSKKNVISISLTEFR